MSGWVPFEHLSNLPPCLDPHPPALQPLQRPAKAAVSFVDPPLTTLFDAYEVQRIQLSFLKEQPEGAPYLCLKEEALAKLQGLREQTLGIDERLERRRALLTKFIKRIQLAPALQAVKRWNWAKTMLAAALKRENEEARERNLEAARERGGHIRRLRSNIEHNNKVDKQTYEIKYEAERKQIGFYESELAKVMTKKAQFQKESMERKLELSQARAALMRHQKAETIKQEDQQVHYKSE